jgi:hypothetical protein
MAARSDLSLGNKSYTRATPPETSAKMNPQNAGEPNLADEEHAQLTAAELAFARCVERLEQLIDRETDALKARAPIDFEDLNLRKTRALWEFSKMSQAMPARKSATIANRLGGLREKLSVNAALLDLHLRAMVEISGIMIRSIRMEESDGPYSGRPSANN